MNSGENDTTRPDGGDPPTGQTTAGESRQRLPRGRRRANGEDGPRSRRTSIVHSEDEFVEVSEQAARQGMTRARMYEAARRSGDVLAGAALADIAVQLVGARRGVAVGLGNLNQIAKVANTTGEVSDEQWVFLRQTARELRDQYDHLNAVLEGLPGGGNL